ncbi:MAG: hypothetical protein OXR82_09565 [Gammaproteobacteria bacterium]|nr:hypothetical protein [Gammaproteobacteria bacterium]MDE0258616.1 hypothetical protein [Gammaproteobacteria bacterium]
MNKMVVVLSVLLLTISSGSLSAQVDGYDLIYSGLPGKRVTMTPDAITEEDLTPDQQQEFRLLIVRDQAGKYFWLSRDMREVIRSDNPGAFTIFHAVDGIGYVKVIRNPSLWGEDAYTYVEHFSSWLNSFTYYGTSELRGDLPR